MEKIFAWIKKNPQEVLIIFSILLIAAFLRFYKISEYMVFLGDEGRDAIIVKKILTQFDLPLIGPPTSVGNMYNGPLYYYMMVVPMAIFLVIASSPSDDGGGDWNFICRFDLLFI